MGSRNRPRKEAKKKPKAKLAQPSLGPLAAVGTAAERRGDPKAAQGKASRRRGRHGSRLIDRRDAIVARSADRSSRSMRSVTNGWR